MRANRIKQIWQDGGAAVNGWAAIPSSLSAETMAHQGWDSLVVDQQHGMVDFATAVTMLQAISTTETVPLTRVPWLEPGIIMKSLDAGAYGVICPMINTRAQAEALVSYCRYAPAGQRSWGPVRALMYAGADYGQHANDHILAMAMIETQQALDNLDEILQVPGLDAVYIGPSDLGLSLGGKAVPDQTDPVVVEAIAQIRTKAVAHGVVPAIHCYDPAYAKQMIDQGFQLVTLATDNTLLAAAAKGAINQLRSAQG